MSPDEPYRPSRVSPSCIFLTVTLLLTATASGLMVLAMMTDHWEYVDFDRKIVEAIAENGTHVEWLLGSRVARLSFPAVEKMPTSSAASVNAVAGVAANATTAEVGRFFALLSKESAAGKPLHVQRDTSATSSSSNGRGKRDLRTVYLVPMYGGVWTICTNLKENEREELAKWGYSNAWCKQYLSPEYITEGPNDWMTRMQNLSISCAMVCLILLSVSTLVGILGILQRQLSAVLITGVMYILAAVFCIFTLSIMHFKRRTSKDCGLVDPMVPEQYHEGQVTTMGWSLAIGWVGVSLCIFSSLLWYLLSKIMRYGPVTFA